MAAGTVSGPVYLWSLPAGRPSAVLRSTGAAASVPLAFSPDGRWLAATDSDHDVLVWDLATGAVRQRFTGHLNEVAAAVWSPDSRALYTAGTDQQILAWDIADERGFGRRTYIAGMLSNTPQNLIRWLRNPQGVVPGNAMPNMGVTDAQARDLAAYLYTIR